MGKRIIRPVVVKYGGSILQSAAVRNIFFKEAVRFARKGLVIVHGGGAEITDYLSKLNVRTRFVRGLRYTDEQAMDAVEMVLSGRVNKQIVSRLIEAGAAAAGVSARDGRMIIARPDPGLGRVGVPVKVNPALLHGLLNAGFIPVVSPVGSDRHGRALNINADTAACALAVAVKARRLIFLTDVPGILDTQGRRIPRISCGQSEQLIRSGIVTGGMIPKLRSSVKAIRHGVREVDIMKGGLLSSFSRGTRILP